MIEDLKTSVVHRILRHSILNPHAQMPPAESLLWTENEIWNIQIGPHDLDNVIESLSSLGELLSLSFFLAIRCWLDT